MKNKLINLLKVETDIKEIEIESMVNMIPSFYLESSMNIFKEYGLQEFKKYVVITNMWGV